MTQPDQITQGTRWCKYHCATCDECFSSLAAFDAHRKGSFYKNTRHCVDPAGVTKMDGTLLLESIEGKCRHGNERGVFYTTLYRFPVEEEEEE